MTTTTAMNLLHPLAETIDLERALAQFARDGYAFLGRVASDEALDAMRARTDDLMLGRVTYEGLFFQHDAETGRYQDLEFGRGWRGPSPDYRKIEKVERDPLFSAWIENPIFERVARACVDDADGIVIYRAAIFSKAARGGTELPFHQDGGRFWGLSRDPELQVWTALDDAGDDAGCVEVVPGSHAAGLATPLGGLVPEDVVARSGNEARIVKVPAKAGEVLLIHNMLWHRSGRNATGAPRRAVTVCYMPGSTRCLRTKRAPRVFHRVWARGERG
jgi:hypothetical protein